MTSNPSAELRRRNLQLETRVLELTQRLQGMSEDLRNVGHSISHDLRAPLRAIDSFCSILDKEYGDKLDVEGRRLIGVVRRNAARMGGLIRDLAAFAHTADSRLIPANIDLGALVRDVLDELRPTFADRQVDVQIDSMPPVTADAALLRKVWLNLLANAIKFTRSRERARIEIGAWIAGEEIICSVRDNGAGFEAEYGHKLFGIFQRLHDSTEFDGNGIGLSVVKRCIDRHGGRVWAEGAPGVGATFYFSLPTVTSEIQ